MSDIAIRLVFDDSRFPKLPGLGNIAWATRGDIKASRDPRVQAEIWCRYDVKFGTRDDYRLWRMVARPAYPSDVMKAWPTPFSAAMAGLGNTDGILLWGVVSVLAAELKKAADRRKASGGRMEEGDLWRDYNSEDGGVFTDDEVRELAERCFQLIEEGVEPVGGCEKECAAIRVVALDGIQRLRRPLKGPLTVPGAIAYLRQLEENIITVDPQWTAGWRPLSMKGISDERSQGNRTHIAPFILPLMALQLGLAIFHARGVALDAVVSGGLFDEAEVQSLLDSALKFAISAWRQARSFRCGEAKRRRDDPDFVPKFNLDDVWRAEMLALWRAAQAARDAGDFLGSARFAFLLLRVIPDTLATSSQFSRLGQNLGHVIREAGLEVDARFARSKADNVAASIARIRGESQSSDASTEGTGLEIAIPRDPFALRVEFDQGTDERWKKILNLYPPSTGHPLLPLGRLIDAVGQGTQFDQDTLRCAFQLRLRYGEIGSADNLLRLLDPVTLDDLCDFAHSIKRASQAMPLGIDSEKHLAWRELLRKKWAELIDADPNWEQLGRREVSKVLILHEILVNRGSAIMQGANTLQKEVLIAKHYRSAAETDISNLLSAGDVAGMYGAATVTVTRLKNWLAENGTLFRGTLGMPFCASVVRVDDRRLSILMLGKGMRCEYKLLTCDASIAERVANIGDFLCAHAQGLGRLPWGSFFRAVGRVLIEGARSIDPTARWLLLSVESEFWALPWQSLVGEVTEYKMVVSLVPNFSWATLNYEWRYDRNLRVLLELSRAQTARPIAERLQVDRGNLQTAIGSVAVILGHGVEVPETEGVPSLCFTSRPLWLDDWMEAGRHRICIIHSCFAGRMRPAFLGDLGGIPSLVLSSGCRLLCAPVAEVPADAAMTFHEQLMMEDGPDEIGLRYLAATEAQRPVALYNLFGFANEPVLWRASRLGDALQENLRRLQEIYDQWEALRPELQELFADHVVPQWDRLQQALEQRLGGRQKSLADNGSQDVVEYERYEHAADSVTAARAPRRLGRTVHHSVLTGVIHDRKPGGYAFILATDGVDYMFHQTDLRGSLDWESAEGAHVQFEVKTPRGSKRNGRAQDVRPLAR